MTSTHLTDPMLGPALALADLVREHSGLPITSAKASPDGCLTLHVDTSAAFDFLAGIFGAIPAPDVTIDSNGRKAVSRWLHTVWRDVEVSLYCTVPADSFSLFALTHNPDPQEWSASERAEYAAFAASQVGVAA